MQRSSWLQTSLWIAFLVLVWGINWPLSKFALHYMPPLLFSGTRTLAGGILLLIISLSRWKQLQFKQNWPIYVLSAVLNVVLYYGLQTLGLGYMPAGLFSAIVFLQPVLVGLFSWFWLGESMTVLKGTGLVLGFAGVAVICSGSGGLAAPLSTIGILLALGTAVSWALGIVFVKRNGTKVDSIWLVSLQLMIGGGFMTLIGSGAERWSDVQWSLSFIASFLFISIFVIAAGWLVFYRLMAAGDASRVASFTFLIPLVAMITGWLFFGEAITKSLLIGILFILASISLVNGSRAVRRFAKKANSSAANG